MVPLPHRRSFMKLLTLLMHYNTQSCFLKMCEALFLGNRLKEMMMILLSYLSFKKKPKALKTTLYLNLYKDYFI